MDFYGVFAPSEIQVQRLSQCIKSIILEFTMKKIAGNAILRGGSISIDDYEYVANSDDKIILLFPIPQKALIDNLALLKIFH